MSCSKFDRILVDKHGQVMKPDVVVEPANQEEERHSNLGGNNFS